MAVMEGMCGTAGNRWGSRRALWRDSCKVNCGMVWEERGSGVRWGSMRPMWLGGKRDALAKVASPGAYRLAISSRASLTRVHICHVSAGSPDTLSPRYKQCHLIRHWTVAFQGVHPSSDLVGAIRPPLKVAMADSTLQISMDGLPLHSNVEISP
jgi:hypothetical protein